VLDENAACVCVCVCVCVCACVLEEDLCHSSSLFLLMPRPFPIVWFELFKHGVSHNRVFVKMRRIEELKG